MTDPHNERRPQRATEGDEGDAGKRSLPILPSAEADRTQARCARCSHPIHAPLSLSTGYGRECRRKLDTDPLEGVAEHGDAL